jgi:hypothetical protein
MVGQGKSRARHLAVAGLALAVVAAASIAAALPAAATPAARGGDYGPDTCLNGFVWREAVSNDHVCVMPGVRTQAARDNAQAAARRSPTGGPYGPDTCLSGYVWREAVAGDHVCVDPRVRDQARSDNLQAASRRNDLRIAVGTYIPPHVWCNGDVCTRSSDDAPRYWVRVDRLNIGQARVVLVSTVTGRAIQSWRRTVPAHSKQPGGWLSFETGMLKCHGAANAYFVVQDGSSGRFSGRQYVTTGCKTL